MNILGLDLASRITGWAMGPPEMAPLAGAWEFDDVGDDLGALLGALEAELDRAATEQPFIDVVYPPITHVVYELPILVVKGGNSTRYTDNVERLRKLYSMGAFVEWWARKHGLIYKGVNLFRLKRELAGFSGAGKDDMIHAAEKLGVVLPATKAHGKEDAADAVANWVYGVRAYAPKFQGWLDRRLYSARGTLL